MSPAARLSLADQALANCLGFIVAQVIRDDRTEVAIAVMEELLPHVNRSSAHMPQICEAAGAVLSAWPMRGRTEGATNWASALMTANNAVSDFLFWRAAMASDAWRSSLSPQTPEAPNAAA
ncbi:MAG: hypothetical protein DI533_04600 [Cereibacter sphaeroides]|uniref:Uncharacterized protein n=1 Tax=Cereibacter sphaeroides TaxID=1063 RepID=A0A2W5SDC3_CERSP|nr:MAG: hypothetical protein DI533_04600 [Cereibacter sphaeroides]